MAYISQDLIQRIETSKQEGRYDEAMKLVNHILIKEPSNEQALLQVADIQYRKGDMDKASKAVDFLNHTNQNNDPIGLYVKGIIEMEKNNWRAAKQYLKQAIELTKFENHEIVRCYGICEYRYGNRSKGLDFVEHAFELNKLDAEVVYNLVELYLLEHRYKKAKQYLWYYYKYNKKLMTFDKTIDYYDGKMSLFDSYIQLKTHHK